MTALPCAPKGRQQRMPNKTYAGIGSRETPEPVLNQMNRIAVWLQLEGFTLRSGGAVGADTAFESGAGVRSEIYRPDDATPEALALAAQFHPAWGHCSEWAKKLHARNGFQVLGRDLGSPSSLVACWTRDGKASGGTGQALRIAAHYGIPIFNLHDATAEERLRTFVAELRTQR